MKYVVLIPIYNDRESLKLLIENINYELKDINHEISIVVINDASSQQIIDTYPNIENMILEIEEADGAAVEGPLDVDADGCKGAPPPAPGLARSPSPAAAPLLPASASGRGVFILCNIPRQ